MPIFITGASRGIGRAIAVEAAKAGWDVAFTYCTNRDAAESVLAELRQLAPTRTHRTYALDVRSSAEVEKVGDRVLEDFEKVDVVVANAGINRNNLVVSMSDDEWQSVIDTNLGGTFYTCRYFLPSFLAQRSGRFVLISSLSATGVTGQANYCASKAGILGLSAALAKEYGRRGITSNVVSPGYFETDMTREGLSGKNRDFWNAYCPVGRLGELDEVAKVVLFLASPAAAFINGQELKVDGGLGWAP